MNITLCDWHEGVIQALERDPYVTSEDAANTAASFARNCLDCQETP